MEIDLGPLPAEHPREPVLRGACAVFQQHFDVPPGTNYKDVFEALGTLLLREGGPADPPDTAVFRSASVALLTARQVYDPTPAECAFIICKTLQWHARACVVQERRDA